MLFSDIATGETQWAELFFIVAIILALLAAWLFNKAAVPSALLSVAIAAVAAGFLLL